MTGDLNVHRISKLIPVSDPGSPLKGEQQNTLQILDDQTVIIRGGKIVAVSPSNLVTSQDLAGAPTIDGSGYIGIPGLVESHSHPLFLGNRSVEYAKRHNSVQDNADQDLATETGDGIAAVVKLTRGATTEALTTQLLVYLAEAMKSGVTTLEVKGGYGLSLEDEIAHYLLVQSVREQAQILLSPTFAAAHVVPSDHSEDSYVAELIDNIFPEAHRKGLFERCDVTIEDGIFGSSNVAHLISRVQGLGSKLVVHADAFSDSGGWKAAVAAGAISADHLTFTPVSAIQETQSSDTIATVLPMAELVYSTSKKAEAREFIRASIPLAIATDYSSTIGHTSLFRAMLFSIPWYGLTVEEVLSSTTLNAAYSLGLQDQVGSVDLGKRGDLLLIKEPDLNTLAWRRVDSAPDVVIAHGRIISGDENA